MGLGAMDLDLDVLRAETHRHETQHVVGQGPVDCPDVTPVVQAANANSSVIRGGGACDCGSGSCVGGLDGSSGIPPRRSLLSALRPFSVHDAGTAELLQISF